MWLASRLAASIAIAYHLQDTNSWCLNFVLDTWPHCVDIKTDVFNVSTLASFSFALDFSLQNI